MVYKFWKNEVENMEINFANRMDGVKGSAIREMFKLMGDPSIISFAGGNPSPDTFPADKLKEIAARVLVDSPAKCLQYSVTEGYAPLVNKVSQRLKKQNILKDKDKVIITTGGQQGIDLGTKAVINPDDGIACEVPSFIGALNCFRTYEAKLYGITLEEDGLNTKELEKTLEENKNIKILYIIPTFQNPMGVTTSLEKRIEILRICKKHNVLIIEDNPYGELRFSGEDVPTIKSLDEDGDTVLYCGSFSKVLSPGLRIGFACANEKLIEKMVVLKQVNDVHTNIFSQILADEWLEKYDFEEHLDLCKNVYKKKCSLMLKTMDEEFPSFVTYTRPEGGLFIYCKVNKDIDTKELVIESIKRKVAFVPGCNFMTDVDEKTSSFRLNYSTMDDESIVKGIKILAELLKTL